MRRWRVNGEGPDWFIRTARRCEICELTADPRDALTREEALTHYRHEMAGLVVLREIPAPLRLVRAAQEQDDPWGFGA